jgi:hypothetical protein
MSTRALDRPAISPIDSDPHGAQRLRAQMIARWPPSAPEFREPPRTFARPLTASGCQHRMAGGNRERGDGRGVWSSRVVDHMTARANVEVKIP